MPFVPAPAARVEMFYNQFGEIVQNVYHVSEGFGPGFDPAELETLGQLFTNWENNIARANRSEQVEHILTRVTDLTSASGAQYSQPSNPPVPGQLSSPVMPGNVTWAVKLQTVRGARGTQGRTFWIGLSEGQCAVNLINAAPAAAIVAALETLRDTLQNAVGVGVLSIVHSQLAGLPLNPRTVTPVTAVAGADLGLDSQRSRLPGKRRKRRTSAP
jgi:hypothetical protein